MKRLLRPSRCAIKQFHFFSKLVSEAAAAATGDPGGGTNILGASALSTSSRLYLHPTTSMNEDFYTRESSASIFLYKPCCSAVTLSLLDNHNHKFFYTLHLRCNLLNSSLDYEDKINLTFFSSASMRAIYSPQNGKHAHCNTNSVP